jgi:hypothetical protein
MLSNVSQSYDHFSKSLTIIAQIYILDNLASQTGITPKLTLLTLTACEI